jgi:lysozyme
LFLGITHPAITNLLEQLARDEGCRLKPYRDTVGKLTIGVGRNLEDVGISKDEADMLLATDIRSADAAVSKALPWTVNIDPIRRAVLVNMAFNLGIEGLLGFKHTLDLVRAGKYEEASDAMLNSKWAEQVGPRAARLSVQMRTGEWQ